MTCKAYLVKKKRFNCNKNEICLCVCMFENSLATVENVYNEPGDHQPFQATLLVIRYTFLAKTKKIYLC